MVYHQKISRRSIATQFFACCSMLVFLFCAVPAAQAVYLKNYPITYTQPSGEKVTLYVTGDEYFRYAHTANGTIVDTDSSGTLRYAKLSRAGKIEANSTKVTQQNKKTFQGLKVGEVSPKKNIISPEMLEQNQQVFSQEPLNIPTDSQKSRLESDTSLTQSSLSDIVVYIRFKGESEFLTPALLSTDETLLNGSGHSLKTFISAQSEGDCTLTSIFPQKNGTSAASYEDSHPRGYYQPYTTANPLGYRTDDESLSREDELIAGATASIASDPDIPAGSELDKDGDGKIDTMSFVVSGAPGAWMDLLWPHTVSFSSDTLNPTINGKEVGRYTFQLSGMYTNRAQLLSVFAHETMHMLGFPDLYRYSYSGTPIGTWDIMATNQTTPQFANAFMRYIVAGWGNEPTEISGSGHFAVKAPTAASTGTESYYYYAGNGDFIVFEYRKNTAGSWDENLTSSGLLVYRIRPFAAMSEYGNMFSGSTLADTYYIYRPGEIAANGLPWYRAAQGSLSSATLSSSNGRSSYGAPYYPGTSLYGYDGSRGSLVAYSVGSTLNDTIDFSVKLQYYVSFDAQGGSGSSSAVHDRGSYLVKPTDPYRSGYKFLGWYTAPTDGTLYGFDTPVTSHMTLYAHWELIPPSTSAYVTSVSKSTGTWNHAWSKTLYYPKYRTLTIGRTKSYVKIRPYYSSKAKLYVRYSNGTWSRITGSKTVYVSRGKYKVLYFKCIAEAGNKHTYKLLVKRNR